jgi:hypothetical protein
MGQLANGAVQAVGQDLTNKVLQNPQCQQALQCTANTLVSTGAAVVGTVAAAGHAATVVGTAVVTGTTLVVAAAAPVAAVAAAGYGLYKLWKWLDS